MITNTIGSQLSSRIFSYFLIRSKSALGIYLVVKITNPHKIKKKRINAFHQLWEQLRPVLYPVNIYPNGDKNSDKFIWS